MSTQDINMRSKSHDLSDAYILTQEVTDPRSAPVYLIPLLILFKQKLMKQSNHLPFKFARSISSMTPPKSGLEACPEIGRTKGVLAGIVIVI